MPTMPSGLLRFVERGRIYGVIASHLLGLAEAERCEGGPRYLSLPHRMLQKLPAGFQCGSRGRK